ncbi:MAG: TPM domain-containing protein [Bacillota bacterium]|nr:TPM domain-containing protein [Bacillota bacterium]
MRKMISIIAAVFMLVVLAVPAFADTTSKVSANDLVIIDKAELFSKSQERSLQEQMTGLCEYGDTIVYTMDKNATSTASAADAMLRKYGNDGMVFVIDMDNREIYLFTTYDGLTAGHCKSITDNVFKYASDGDYFTCAKTALEQSQTVLAGQRIAQPMKYINNALLAVIVAMIINFIWMATTSRKSRASSYEVAGNVKSKFSIKNSNLRVTGTRVVHVDLSDLSGGDSSSGGGGGGHGGGHRF